MAASLAIPKSYQRLGAFPLDDSTSLVTIADRDSLVQGVRYLGMICYVEETQTLYVLKGGLNNENWIPVSTTDNSVEINKKFIATEAIMAGKFVRTIGLNSVELADVEDKYDSVIGMALTNAESGEEVLVKTSGISGYIGGEELQVGKQCFLGNNGEVVQDLESSPLMLYVGKAVSPNEIEIQIDNEIIVFE